MDSEGPKYLKSKLKINSSEAVFSSLTRQNPKNLCVEDNTPIIAQSLVMELPKVLLFTFNFS